jgi:hypothetical protein
VIDSHENWTCSVEWVWELYECIFLGYLGVFEENNIDYNLIVVEKAIENTWHTISTLDRVDELKWDIGSGLECACSVVNIKIKYKNLAYWIIFICLSIKFYYKAE